MTPASVDHDVAIDITFDVQSDSNGRDPDAFSRTLNQYHWRLWSKPLPDGSPFALVRNGDPSGPYSLRHSSPRSDLFLTSDAITHSYRNYAETANVPSALIDEVFHFGCRVGAYTVFPGDKRPGVMTLNQARGTDRRIRDRFDLTLEAIRLWYDGYEAAIRDHLGQLGNSIPAYADFFERFGDFEGYVKHFLLDDLVDSTYSSVLFHLPFDGFANPYRIVPTGEEEYLEYSRSVIRFVLLRNTRIDAWANGSV